MGFRCPDPREPRGLGRLRGCGPIRASSTAEHASTATITRAHRIQSVSKISRKTILARVATPSICTNPGTGLFEGLSSRTSYKPQTHLVMVLPLLHRQFVSIYVCSSSQFVVRPHRSFPRLLGSGRLARRSSVHCQRPLLSAPAGKTSSP